MAAYSLFFFIMLICVLFSQIQCYSLQSACELAKDPESCHFSLLQDPRSSKAGAKDLTKISLEISLTNVERIHSLIPPLGWVGRAFDAKFSQAFGNCLTFYDLAVQHLKQAQLRLSKSSSSDLKWNHAVHIQTLLSAAQTNQRTCLTALQYAHVNLSQFTFSAEMHNASEAVSNSLGLIKKLWVAGKAPVHHNRRLLSGGDSLGLVEDGFPWWASRSDKRKLLQSYSRKSSRVDATVAKDGSGQYKTIAEAIKAAPENSPHKYIIHIKGGVYNENLVVPSTKPNIVLEGDGMDATVLTSNKGMGDGVGFIQTATLVVYSNGFVARDLTIQNTAGPAKMQALALVLVSDMAVVYRCKLMGFQDTLYAHSLRQFYRECEIYGTIDFICGNAAAVFQRCNIYVRRPLAGQQNVITAQDRTGPNENTAIVLDSCKVTESNEVKSSGGSVTAFLGRPWGKYSRTVYMNSYLDDLIDPQGWLAWPNRDHSKTVYYGEYKNKGPSADTSRRCNWPGFHVMSAYSAAPLTASTLLHIDGWLPAGIPADKTDK